MNEIRFYEEASYHISKIHSVFVTLDGSTLRLQRPSQGIPKRAMWNEQIGQPVFKHQRYYELRDARVSLLPEGLVRKRQWSKKYPICIEIPVIKKTKATFGQSFSSNDIASSSFFSSNVQEKLLPSFNSKEHAVSKVTALYLFARASREKEEWFRRFVMAANGTPLPVSLSQFVTSRRAAHGNHRKSSEGSIHTENNATGQIKFKQNSSVLPQRAVQQSENASENKITIEPWQVYKINC